MKERSNGETPEMTRCCNICLKEPPARQIVSWFGFEYGNNVVLMAVCYECMTSVRRMSSRKITREDNKVLQRLLRNEPYRGGEIEFNLDKATGTLSSRTRFDEEYRLGMLGELDEDPSEALDSLPSELTKNGVSP